MRLFVGALILVSLFGFGGCSSEDSRAEKIEAKKTVDSQIESAVMAEAVVAALRPKLKKIIKRLEAGQDDVLNEFSVREISFRGPKVIDFSSRFSTGDEGRFDWPLDDSVTIASSDVRLWPNLCDFGLYDLKAGTLAGEFAADLGTFRHRIVCDGKFKHEDRYFGFKATQTLQWKKKSKGWFISSWHQDSVEVKSSQKLIFRDVTTEAIPDDELRSRVTAAAHEQLIRKKLQDGSILRPFDPDHPLIFDVESSYQFPGVNIVDYDLDGDDDVFLYEAWAPCLMLRNDGNGVFTDSTVDCGLDVDKAANCAVFADFDNDGDPDAFIGRSTESSLYFENVNGTFQRNTEFEKQNPHLKFASTATPVDINRDGLLDLYVTTYAPFGPKPNDFVNQYLADSDHAMAMSVANNHTFLDRSGPPNAILMNESGKLSAVESDLIRQFRCSFEDVWHDFDGDGDFDLYLCNDFAPDVVLRNDTARLSMEPVFTDITDELLGGQMGFGMGASLGDYDNDGDLDIYVSNMYSKAGNRIFQHFEDVNPDIAAAAKGNILFQRNGDSFSEVSSAGGPAYPVAKVGWSFGGQFADFNNDAELDLYVPSGFFTAPKEVDSDADL